MAKRPTAKKAPRGKAKPKTKPGKAHTTTRPRGPMAPGLTPLPPAWERLPHHLQPPLAPKKTRTQNRRSLRGTFLRAFKQCASVRMAAKVAGICFTTHYRWMKTDPRYRAAFERTELHLRDLLIEETIRRAVHGTVAPVYQGGKLVGHKREFSDSLLLKLLAARGGPEFRDKMQHELSEGPVQLTVNHVRKPIPNFGAQDDGEDDRD